VTLRGLLPIAAIVGLVLALALWGTLREPDNDRKALAATTYSSGPNGAKALYLLLEQSGLTVTRLRRLTYVGDGPDAVLWILAPSALPTGDAEPLVDSLQRGGTVVASPALAADLLVRAGAAGARDETADCPAGGCAIETPWGLALTAATRSARRIAGVEPIETYASLGRQPIVARYAVGQGSVVALGTFDSLRNDAIGAGDSGPFLVRLAAALGESHAFDEMHTGYGDLNLLTLLWRAHVQAVADWWARSGDLGLPLTSLLAGLDARAAGRMHAPGGRNFVAWATAVRPDLGARAAQAWGQAEQLLARKRSSPREVVTVASALRALEKEVFPC
jgi:hypothetical protein